MKPTSAVCFLTSWLASSPVSYLDGKPRENLWNWSSCLPHLESRISLIMFGSLSSPNPLSWRFALFFVFSHELISRIYKRYRNVTETQFKVIVIEITEIVYIFRYMLTFWIWKHMFMHWSLRFYIFVFT